MPRLGRVMVKWRVGGGQEPLCLRLGGNICSWHMGCSYLSPKVTRSKLWKSGSSKLHLTVWVEGKTSLTGFSCAAGWHFSLPCALAVYWLNAGVGHAAPWGQLGCPGVQQIWTVITILSEITPQTTLATAEETCIPCTQKLCWNYEADLFVLLFHQRTSGCVFCSRQGFPSLSAHLHHTGELLSYSDFGVYVFHKCSQKLKQTLELCFLAFQFSFLFLTTSFVSLLFRETIFAHRLLLNAAPVGSSWRQQGLTAYCLSATEGRSFLCS